MPVVPEFQPAAPSGQGFRQSASLMMQASANRRAEEAAQMDRAKFDILRPVMESEARLKIMETTAGMEVTREMNNFVSGAMTQLPQLVRDWNFTATIGDAPERIAARREVLARASALGGLKQFEPVLQSWQKQFADDAIADRTADTLQNKLDIANVNAGANLDARRLQVEAKEREFALRQQHAQELEKAKQEGRMALQSAQAESRAALEATKGQNTRSGAREKESAKLNDAAIQLAQPAQSELARYETAMTLLQDPSVRTGTGAAFEAAARRLGSELGMDVGKVSNIEQLQSILGSTFLTAARSMKGALSDKDVATLERISPGVGKSNEGNIAILQFLMAQRQRELELADLVARGRREGDSEREIQLDIYDFIRANPIRVGGASSPAPTGVKIQSIQRID